MFGKNLHTIFHHTKDENPKDSLPKEQNPASQGSMGNDVPGTNLVELSLPLTNGGYETLLIPNDHHPRGPQCPDPEHWHFRHGSRKASVAAADTGDTPKGASDVEKAEFILLTKQTQGMSAEEVKEFLEKRGVVDGFNVMKRQQKGQQGAGYYQVVGADSGAM